MIFNGAGFLNACQDHSPRLTFRLSTFRRFLNRFSF